MLNSTVGWIHGKLLRYTEGVTSAIGHTASEYTPEDIAFKLVKSEHNVISTEGREVAITNSMVMFRLTERTRTITVNDKIRWNGVTRAIDGLEVVGTNLFAILGGPVN